MKKHLILRSIIVIGLLLLLSEGVFASGLMGQGETGSSVDSSQGEITNFQLKKSDGTYVTVYSGTGYVEMVGEAGQEFAGEILGIMPPNGTYVGWRASASRIKRRIKKFNQSSTRSRRIRNTRRF
jgi:hypothetical protein